MTPAGGTFTMTDVDAYAAEAKAWLRDKSNLSDNTINSADYSVALDYFRQHAGHEGETMAAKKTATAKPETVEVDESLADALGDAAGDVDPLAAAVEQAQANIDRAFSLAEAENVEGLAELAKEHEDLVSSMPSRGNIPTGDMTWAAFKQASRNDFRKASQAQPKAPEPKAAELELKAKADAAAADYTTVEGVKERVDATVKLVAEGSLLQVKMAQTARQAAETFLAGQRLILTKEGLPDLKCVEPKSTKARRDVYDLAREELAKQGDPAHAKSLVAKFKTAVHNQTSGVLVGMIRALDDSPEEFAQHYSKIAELKPELAGLTPSEQVFEYYGIPRQSKQEIMAAREAEKRAKVAELEAAKEAAKEGDSEAAEKVEELKTVSVQEKIVNDVERAEEAIKAAIKAAKALSAEDRSVLSDRIGQLTLLTAELKAESVQEKIANDVKRAGEAIKAAKELGAEDRDVLKAHIAQLTLLAAEL